MDSSLISLEFDRVVSLISLEAKSDPGRAALARRSPGTSVAECERLQSELAEMVGIYAREGLLPFAGLVDVRPLLALEAIDFDESWQLLRAVRATQALRESILRNEHPLPHLALIARRIPDLDDLVKEVARFFTRDGKMRDDASPELRAIRKKIQAKRGAIQKSLNDLMNRHGEAIQDPLITIRGDRYCIPVRADHRSDVPGILHERSGSGASFFIEPLSVVESNNDLADFLIQEREEIARIARYIGQQFAARTDELRDAVEASGELDAIQACAILHRMAGASRPAFSTSELRLLEARHPLLDERLAQLRQTAFGETDSPRHVVPTSVEISSEKPALIVTGPNAGGKTVALKTAGLLVAMATSGFPLPAAEGSVIPVVDAIHVVVGDDQNVLEHLSTFSAHLVHIKRVLARATPRSLVLLDELGGGTDPEEGAAIAAAVIEHLLDTGCLLVVTTHLSSIKSFALEDPRVVNASMEFDPESNQPTFRLIAGIPGRSRAIEVAKMIGLPASIIEAARRRLGDEHGHADRLIAELQKTMQQIHAREAELSELVRSAEHERAQLRRESEEMREKKQKLSSTMREEVDRIRDDVTRRFRGEIGRLRDLDAESRRKLQPAEAFERVVEPIREIEMAEEEKSEPVSVGDRAEHRKFKFSGEVLSIEGDRVQLSVNGKKMQANLGDLRKISPKADAKKAKQQPRADTNSDESTIGAELNLIGHHVDEAIEESDRFIDRSLLNGTKMVRLIHGHGTGTLRRALRDYLKTHPGVKSLRAGTEKEGGDAATIAVLDV